MFTHLGCIDGQVAAELAMDSDEADEEKKKGSPLILYVFGRGYVQLIIFHFCPLS
jgi:hypothetical protein